MTKTPVTLLVVALAACGPPETKITRLTPSVSVVPGDLTFGEVVPGLRIDKNVQVLSSGQADLEITAITLSLIHI